MVWSREAYVRSLALLLILAACDDRVDTNIRLIPPDGVGSSSFTHVDVRVFPAGVACSVLSDALRQSCDAGCADGTSAARLPFDARWEQPSDRAESPAMEGEAIGTFELSVGSDGPWSVLVAVDRGGMPPLYGCAEILASEAHTQVVLGWDWCDAASEPCDVCTDALDTTCHGFHPACGVQRACDVHLADAVPEPRTTLTEPSCIPETSAVAYYQDEAIDCQTVSEGFQGTFCQPAVVDCAARLDEGAVSAGQCPGDDPPCLDLGDFRTATDFDCDGSLPPLCGRPEDCMDGAACNVQGCEGTVDCAMRTCVPTPIGTTDGCNGADDDCDGDVDEGGQGECSQLVGANQCIAGECRCGLGAVCTAGKTCCGARGSGVCADLTASKDHCGTCFNACQEDFVCYESQCVSRDRVPFMPGG